MTRIQRIATIMCLCSTIHVSAQSTKPLTVQGSHTAPLNATMDVYVTALMARMTDDNVAVLETAPESPRDEILIEARSPFGPRE